MSQVSKPNMSSDIKLCVIGLGYVGLPLFHEFSMHFDVVGFDIDRKRILELKKGIDRNVSIEFIKSEVPSKYSFTCDVDDIKSCNVYVITVPTPINDELKPDLAMLKSATAIVGSCLKHGDLVIFESTVYPGATEEVCIPLLQQSSGLSLNADFGVGYSPERINPGDNEHTLKNTVKIVSGSCHAVLHNVEYLYSMIVSAGLYKAKSIRVAETAKVFENTQRDVNIALANEFSLICDALDINTTDVLNAAATKWNFHKYSPGLVGGHCIGVDPYYLINKVEEYGFNPKIIKTARAVNEYMPHFISEKIIHDINSSNLSGDGGILILGLTFKADCNDVRNSKSVELAKILRNNEISVSAYDPYISDSSNVGLENIRLLKEYPVGETFAAIILSVEHQEFRKMEIAKIKSCLHKNGVFFDLKSLFDKTLSDFQL